MTMIGVADVQHAYVRTLAPTADTFSGGSLPTAGTPARRRRIVTSGIDLRHRTL
ncbi:hypothetical protein [Cellulomonas shaoxiangyii]|uniref:hypothetical protein n=1 Tax=Cellulomonas shaoxiangyii TaxID=2566013 RepID=UPI00140A1116|nr:hypothetical protein [Cellulomonas shaoxiangyii]